jgi:hypothetical protein
MVAGSEDCGLAALAVSLVVVTLEISFVPAADAVGGVVALAPVFSLVVVTVLVVTVLVVTLLVVVPGDSGALTAGAAAGLAVLVPTL